MRRTAVNQPNQAPEAPAWLRVGWDVWMLREVRGRVDEVLSSSFPRALVN